MNMNENIDKKYDEEIKRLKLIREQKNAKLAAQYYKNKNNKKNDRRDH